MRRALTALAIALSATSGATIPQAPPEPQYMQPAEATYTLSTLKGSQIDRTLMDDFTVYVLN
ncbi:MAG TPA: hypothetical protein VET30_01160, partial [Pseudoxanthomonas sp.]|nr:hypothetical protein [Pseudoxanthomonas sp.]